MHTVSRSFLSQSSPDLICILHRTSSSNLHAADTITVPTPEMMSYAALSSLGDAVYHEAATEALEKHMARLTGKEAALFLPSGTMSNQIAIRTHLTQPPHSIVCDARTHIHKYEAGGAAFHSQAAVIPIHPANGHHITLEEIIHNADLTSDIHFAPTKLIVLENTLNGTIFPQDEILRIAKFAKENDLKLHLDGARIWHVAAELAIPLEELVSPFDSVSICFSKGLGAPIGTCLMGPAAFINKARWLRKLFGGGMRQTGFLSASAAYAVSNNFEKLFHVHELTRRIEKGLIELGAEILSPAETCMVFYDPAPLGLEYAEILERAAKLPDPITLGGSRLVCHIQTSDQAVADFLALISQLKEEKKAEGWVPPEKTHVNGNGVIRDVYVRPKAIH
ncbi:hypothetical protein SISSUDRAFT_1012719 [Sistotremastrum suecicum HHB10207 ss-3]|uniref:Aromatic amino acid beta-eliminating lyase/threonine aldolase domain-containing protein n=1 Tax=Sistotremastrum suecicum HHB10207 ss-3 TaxID=1314776 RepID=A0A166J9K4_9AGAM|nr:hypothetical protein SISSUDRAFT_1012719 [Sistotremastrum suecicum HHB10207 ss-3]